MTLPFGLGGLAVTSPLWLVALALIPLLFLRGRDGSLRRGAAPRAASRGVAAPLAPRRASWVAAGCRAVAVTAVVLALAGLTQVRVRPESGTCVVAAIDVSASVQQAAADRARAFLARLLPALGPRDLLGSLSFASRARVVTRPAAGGRPVSELVPAPALDISGFESGDTDLTAALVAAAPLCPEGKQPALVLFTDGGETEGNLLAEAALTEPRLPVYPVVPDAAALPPATIRRLLAPAFAAEHTVLPLEAVIETRADAVDALLELSANGERLGRTGLALAAGVSVVTLPYRLTGAGQYLLEAELQPSGAAPSRTRAALTVTRPVRVLTVSARATPAAAAALAERGMEVEIVAPSGLASRAPHLREYHLVVLDDVARADLGATDLDAIARYVAAGGGLVVTGGEHLFGDPGLVDTPLARVLPVALRSQTPDPQEREPIALYLVIDRSNSMGYGGGDPLTHSGEKMAYAKRAALAVLGQLGAQDLVGAIAFDSQPYELGPLLPAGECRAALSAHIQQLQYGGGTDFKEALDIARRGLVESGRGVRHVILLTDGDTNRAAEEHAGLIAALARDEVTVTSIRIGSDTVNLDLLDAISRATGGEFHHVENVEALPQLMIRDAQRMMESAGERREARARVAQAQGILAGIREEELPPVTRWALVRPRHGSEVRLYVESGEQRDPLLATWQYELGRVAVVPLDFQAGAAAWAAWDGFGKLWSQLALWAAPRGLAQDRHLEAHREREGTRITLETIADDPGPFSVRLPEAGEVSLRQVGMRAFATTVPGLRAGVHAAVLVDGAGAARTESPLDLMVPADADGGRERSGAPPNLRLLERVAAATGGTVNPEPSAVLTARPGVRRESTPVDWLLIPLAIAAILTDIALRRAL